MGGRRRELNRKRTPQAAVARRQSTAAAVVAKNGDVVLLSGPDGQIPRHGNHALGLYYHDCRFLDGYELRIGDAVPDVLLATAEDGFCAIFELTNPAVVEGPRSRVAPHCVAIRWERTIDAEALAVHDVLTLRNFALDRIVLPLTLAFASRFEDVFAVRGMPGEHRGRLRRPAWRRGALRLAYDGADGIHRSLMIHFAPPPDERHGATATFRPALDADGCVEIVVTLVLRESPGRAVTQPGAAVPGDVERVRTRVRESSIDWMRERSEVRSDNPRFDACIDRALRDLCVLRSSLRGREFIAAGVPWYVTLFGRDSLVAALQTLAFQPVVAASTLRLLASYQATTVDDWRDAEPGKIPHELRVGEMARLGEIPQTPYYGTVDATPLFLILLGRHAQWTGRLDLFEELRPSAERALDWIAVSTEASDLGYLAYETTSPRGLRNQGWKDSDDAIMNADGTLATAPIALVEVQGYVYRAWRLLADLYRRAGDAARAETLEAAAAELRTRFNDDFWVDDAGFYALALQKGHGAAAVRSSNPGQAFWTGIADPDKARRTIEAFLTPEMFSGWGVRTLSTAERRYNPVGYHLGTVWPHDNAFIAAGCRHYGCDAVAERIFGGLVAAAGHFAHHRLPEVFAGFSRDVFAVPVRYPIACHPQAWAASAIPFLLETMLGLVPEAFEGRLRIERPILPAFLNRVCLRRLRVGDARVDLRFERGRHGIAVEVLDVSGDLQIVLDQATTG